MGEMACVQEGMQKERNPIQVSDLAKPGWDRESEE
jgi:hypothetical protein